MTEKYLPTIIIGGGQAGLAAGYYLSQHGLQFVILDANEQIGDGWRQRWNSLRLFTPAKLNGLPGLLFPGNRNSFPAKDKMAAYLAAYADHFSLPVKSGVRATHLSREGRLYRVITEAGDIYYADQIVVATGAYENPRIPNFASHLKENIRQLHSSEYTNPTQVENGSVLVVGAGNSGAEIAVELAASHCVYLAGRDTGYVPFRIGGFWGRLFLLRFVLRFLFHHIFTTHNPIGRKIFQKIHNRGQPLIRLRPRDLRSADIKQVPKVVDIRNGLPLLEDGRTLEVQNVIWCTGYRPGFSWIDLPIFNAEGEPIHNAGVVESEPGIYFIGLHFLYAMSSSMIHGVGRDAARIASVVAARSKLTHQDNQEEIKNGKPTAMLNE